MATASSLASSSLSPSLLQEELLAALRTKVIPWVQADGIQHLVLLRPPLRVPPQVKVVNQPLPPLPESRRHRSYSHFNRWPEAGLDAMQLPYLGCVLEGEADLRLGITQRMVKEIEGLDKTCGCQVLTLPQQTFFLIPPGVPHSDGSRPHWERLHPQSAYSRIFWLHIFSSGVLCHICTTQGGTHISQPLLFVADAQVMALAELLFEEVQARHIGFETVAQANLLLLLLRVERGLATQTSPRVLNHPSLYTPDLDLDLDLSDGESQDLSPTGIMALKRACQYIKTHLDEPLTPALIAEHAYVSPSYLKHIFQSGLGTSVMKFVTQRRMEMAKSLLQDTDMPIGEIARLVGYPHHAHFGQVFRQQTQLTPGEYRKRHRLGLE